MTATVAGDRPPAGRPAPVYSCPFCADEALRPDDAGPDAWRCSSCARAFTVRLLGVIEDGIPGRAAAAVASDPPPTGAPTSPSTPTPMRAQPAGAPGRAGRALVDDAAYHLRVAEARRALHWAADTFGDRFTVATSMGDTALPHLVATTVPHIDCFFLDTGYHFPQTLATRDAYAERLTIRTISPRRTVPEQDGDHGERLHDRDPDLCCALRKVEPLTRALQGYHAWGSGLRRSDAESRRDVEVVEWDERRGLVKVNPLAAWSDADVQRYLTEHAVPENPLTGQGYRSIGCAPCTRALRPGESPRAGRWSGHDKTECGLHI